MAGELAERQTVSERWLGELGHLDGDQLYQRGGLHELRGTGGHACSQADERATVPDHLHGRVRDFSVSSTDVWQCVNGGGLSQSTIDALATPCTAGGTLLAGGPGDEVTFVDCNLTVLRPLAGTPQLDV